MTPMQSVVQDQINQHLREIRNLYQSPDLDDRKLLPGAVERLAGAVNLAEMLGLINEEEAAQIFRAKLECKSWAYERAAAMSPKCGNDSRQNQTTTTPNCPAGSSDAQDCPAPTMNAHHLNNSLVNPVF